MKTTTAQTDADYGFGCFYLVDSTCSARRTQFLVARDGRSVTISYFTVGERNCRTFSLPREEARRFYAARRSEGFVPGEPISVPVPR